MVQNIWLGRVLVDGGSSINLLFTDALDTLQILRNSLKPSPPFFGITLGSSAKSLGQIKVPITFGSPDNFRTEKVLFDVADFGIAYNAILGRSAIKIHGPTGAITVARNAKTALHCDKWSLDMVELTPRSQHETAEPNGWPVKVQVIASPNDRLKAVSLDNTNLTKTVQIGASLDPK
ncbi:uncharacterized protein LOC133884202 [Phragmites australis]|uniref:uncharacterized protein LOC133884202 n=1 Tax=Phragmites australis TaxID=29695 RepID=UPI002D77FE62|nr:uncharacterized protein LOC133884202 [Phragmites australis]